MQNHKLILILKSLSQKELNAFVRMVNTPYFNRKEEVILLIEYLKKQYPKFSENSVEKDKVFKVISKEKVFNNRFLDDTVYYSIKLLEQFLVIETLQNNSGLQLKILMESYKNRDLSELSLKVIEKYRKQEKDTFLSFNSILLNYDFELNSYLMEKTSYKESSTDSLYAANNNLNICYWLGKLHINDEINSRQEVLSSIENVIQPEEKKILENVLEKTNHDFLKIFYFFNFPDELYVYEEVKQIYLSHTNNIAYLLNRKILSSFINYCKKSYSKSQEPKFIKEWFDWYKIGIDSKILYSFGGLNDTTYLNIVHLGIVQKEFDWIGQFIQQSKDIISDKQLFDLSQGMYFYAVKDYDKALNVLLEVTFGHIHQNLNARSIIAKIYFESKQYDLLENHLNAYEIYLRRQDEISEQLKEVNINFVLACKKLVKAQFDKKVKASLQKDIKEKPIAYKSWFISLL